MKTVPSLEDASSPSNDWVVDAQLQKRVFLSYVYLHYSSYQFIYKSSYQWDCYVMSILIAFEVTYVYLCNFKQA